MLDVLLTQVYIGQGSAFFAHHSQLDLPIMSDDRAMASALDMCCDHKALRGGRGLHRVLHCAARPFYFF